MALTHGAGSPVALEPLVPHGFSGDDETACDVAGVEDVDVVLEGPGGEELTETFACTQDGAVFQNLAVGRWTIRLDAFGTYHAQELHLFGLSADVEIVDGREVDLGDLALSRDEASFADIQVEWVFNASTCAAEGLTTMQLAIKRSGLAEPEDVTTVTCADAVELRRTFVPGTYTITLGGVGTTATWTSTATLDLGPDTTAVVPLQLAPQ